MSFCESVCACESVAFLLSGDLMMLLVPSGAFISGAVFAGAAWGEVVRTVGEGTMFRAGTSPSSTSTSSNASALSGVAGSIGGNGRSGLERSGFVSPVSLAGLAVCSFAPGSGGLINTMPPHLGQAIIWPTTPVSRTFSRDLQVVQVRTKLSTPDLSGNKAFKQQSSTNTPL